jgi:uncharacterized protein YggU (UPF0235/DUF167 family)
MTRKNPARKGGTSPAPGALPGGENVWKIEIHVKPGQSRSFLKKDDLGWVLGIREPAREGLANRGVLKALARVLDIPVSMISIIRGEGSRVKLIGVRNLAAPEGLLRLERAIKSVEGE